MHIQPYCNKRNNCTLCKKAMIQERASLPIISLQPVVAGAAKKTSRVVGKAAKTFLNYISPGEYSSADEYEGSADRTES